MHLLHFSTFLATTAALAVGQVITCGGSSNPPSGSTLVQIGFESSLNWNFVSANPTSAAQICSLLPEGVADGLNLSSNQVVATSLVPLAKDGYTATVAKIYIPSTSVATLQRDIRIASSALYNNPDTNIDALMEQIDASIAIA